MAQYLYINADPAAQPRATALGCGWVNQVPPQFGGVASAPCVVVSGAGQTVVLADDGSLTAAQVQIAAQPVVTAEQAAASAAATLTANAQTLQVRAQQALTANATYQAIASPTNAQTAAQVQALTKQCNGIIRLLLNQLDTTTGT